MTLIDYVVLAIVGFSVLLSVLRGFVRELLALAAWAVAFIVARLFGGDGGLQAHAPISAITSAVCWPMVGACERIPAGTFANHLPK